MAKKTYKFIKKLCVNNDTFTCIMRWDWLAVSKHPQSKYINIGILVSLQTKILSFLRRVLKK